MSDKEEHDDDEDAQRRAFREFMLRGKTAASATSNDVGTPTGAGGGIGINAGSGSKKSKKKKKSNRSRMEAAATTPRQQQLSSKSTATTPSSSVRKQQGGIQQVETNEQRKIKRAKWIQSRKKGYECRFTAFHQTFLNEWIGADDNACKVVHSISNLRYRCWHASKIIRIASTSSSDDEMMTAPWRGGNVATEHNGTATTTTTMNANDVELALTHDLLQHERMMSGLRSLLQSMAQAQEALGRRYDEILLYHLEQEQARASYHEDGYFDEDGDEERGYHSGASTGDVGSSSISFRMEQVRELYAASASELYRKQLLAGEVFSSATDSMLFREHHDEDDDDEGSEMEEGEEEESSVGGNGDANTSDAYFYYNDDNRRGGSVTNPRRVAQRCADRWNRTSYKGSYLLPHAAFLQRLSVSSQSTTSSSTSDGGTRR